MDETGSIAQRVSWISMLVVAVLAIALVSFISKLDARDRQFDYDLLRYVAYCNDDSRPDRITSHALEDGALRHVKILKRDSDIIERYHSGTKALEAWLRSVGAQRARADDGTPRRTRSPGFALAQFVVNSHDRDLLRADLTDDHSVAAFVERVFAVSSLRDLRIALPKESDFTSLEAPAEGTYVGLAVTEDGFDMWFGHPNSYVPSARVEVECEVVVIEKLGIVDAVFIQSGKTSLVRLTNIVEAYDLELSEIEPAVRRLAEYYGHMPMGLAQEAAAQDALDAFGKIDVFGFQFSTRRFPVAAAAVLIALMIGLLATVSATAEADGRPLANASGGAIEALLRRTAGRVALWVLLPPATIFLSLPLATLSLGEMIGLSSAAGVATLLGLYAVVVSRKA